MNTPSFSSWLAPPPHLPDVAIRHVVSPLPSPLARRVDAFLLRIFEYGDYSFRSALGAAWTPGLRAHAFLAFRRRRLAAVCMSLIAPHNPAVALLGPIATDPACRSLGLGATLLRHSLNFLENQNARAVYLGVAPQNPARALYTRFGFKARPGVVMRRLFCSPAAFQRLCYSPRPPLLVRPLAWQDLCSAAALLACPTSLIAFDLAHGLFSPRFVPTHRFLGVLPDLMKRIAAGHAHARVLLNGPAAHVVGLAHLTRSPALPLRHLGLLDFYLHDHFLPHALPLLRQSLADAPSLRLDTVCCLVPRADHDKRRLLTALCARLAATVPQFIALRNSRDDLLLYQYKVSS